MAGIARESWLAFPAGAPEEFVNSPAELHTQGYAKELQGYTDSASVPWGGIQASPTFQDDDPCSSARRQSRRRCDSRAARRQSRAHFAEGRRHGSRLYVARQSMEADPPG